LRVHNILPPVFPLVSAVPFVCVIVAVNEAPVREVRLSHDPEIFGGHDCGTAAELHFIVPMQEGFDDPYLSYAHTLAILGQAHNCGAFHYRCWLVLVNV